MKELINNACTVEGQKYMITGRIVSAPIPIKIEDGMGCFWIESTNIIREGMTIIGSRVVKHYTCVRGSAGEVMKAVKCSLGRNIYVSGRLQVARINYNEIKWFEYLKMEECGIVYEEEERWEYEN